MTPCEAGRDVEVRKINNADKKNLSQYCRECGSVGDEIHKDGDFAKSNGNSSLIPSL